MNGIYLPLPFCVGKCPVLAAAKLAPVDWAIIVIYLIGIIGLGVWLGRGQKTTRDYFLRGRDLPW